MFWGYFPSSSHPFSTTTTTTTICTCLRGMFHYVKKHLCYVSITTCTLPYVNYMVSLCLVLNMSEHRSKNAHCRFPWLKLCPQDSVIRVVLFHGLVFFFLFFFYEGETQSWRLSQIFISEEVVKLYMKKKRQKRKAAVSLHGHVLLTKWKYHREDGLNLGELRPREKWNHEWTHMHKKKNKNIYG